MTHPFWLIGGTILLASIPLVVSVATSYLKVQIVLSMIRNGLATQQVPSTVIVAAMALVISMVVMGPTVTTVISGLDSIQGLRLDSVPSTEVLAQVRTSFEPLVQFMDAHTGERERAAMLTIAKDSGINLSHRLMGFMLTELREAFTMGFIVLLPFLAIDLIVANVLVGLGMMMVSPTLLSLPLKLIMFVYLDGWLLLTRGLVASYAGGTYAP